MALLEFYCEACQHRFEQLTSDRDPDRGKCPKCEGNQTRRLISRFHVAGRGDLRETTFHGCHDVHLPMRGMESSGYSHDHGHDHGHGSGSDHADSCGHDHDKGRGSSGGEGSGSSSGAGSESS